MSSSTPTMYLGVYLAGASSAALDQRRYPKNSICLRCVTGARCNLLPDVDEFYCLCDPMEMCEKRYLTLSPGLTTYILVTAGLHDPCVMYSEPTKFLAKLRELKTANIILRFKCELGAGHFSKSGRFEELQEDAFTYAFILKTLNMFPSLGSAL